MNFFWENSGEYSRGLTNRLKYWKTTLFQFISNFIFINNLSFKFKENKFVELMYISASYFFLKKMINTYSNLEIRVVCGEFLAFKFKYVIIVFSKQIRWLFIFVFVLVDSKWILCSRKMVLNGAYLRFLMYKVPLSFNIYL